ncbi:MULTISPECIES: DUF397 domain-containing protein [unclassified Streptomyces]|uniref:DUF397 domain-containing protein n=1 Tax=unclassified Streptomyces TaxID=2593676 RepID=UPI00081B4D82|nr:MULTISPECIES: DUF397 domain-containing protein [unclassified Streptomyces]MYQ83469.1 DUF397 domain-containing protein [Streptomyces sp. SID4936]SCD66857.1 protein of unknown function [Streptomyces sp. DvalAA-43]
MTEEMDLPAAELEAALWHTSTYSGSNNNCVEHAALISGRQAVRDSKDPGLGAQVFGPASWRVFVAAVCDGVI